MKNTQETHIVLVLRHLRRGRKITPLEALRCYGCFRLSAVIFNIKKQLKPIEYIHTETERVGNKNFAKYSLKKYKK